MVNPLLLAPLLNASSLLNASISAPDRYKCWPQNPPGEPQLTLLTYKVCREAVASIPMGEKSLAPVTFGRKPDAGFQVPQTWSRGNCAIKIDVVAEEAEETTTFAAILKRGFDLTVDCVIKEPHLGGTSLIGKKKMLSVSISASESNVSSE